MHWIIASLFVLTIDQPIRLEPLFPYAHVFIKAQAVDQKGVLWHSWGEFVADEEGVLDLSRADALSGSYTGIDPNGLFRSMQPESGQRDLFKCKEGRFEVQVSLYAEKRLLARQIVQRTFSPETLGSLWEN